MRLESTPIDRAIDDAQKHAQKRANETGQTYHVWLVHYASAGHGVGAIVYVRADGDPPKAGDDQELQRYSTFEPQKKETLW